MYVLKHHIQNHEEGGTPAKDTEGEVTPAGTEPPRREADIRIGAASGAFSEDLNALVYLDPRAFIRESVGRLLQSSLSRFKIWALPNAEEIKTAPIKTEQIRAVIINTASERMSSGGVVGLLSRLSELLPSVPVVVLSDYEDTENIREAFGLGVRGYIPNSMTSTVAVEAMHLVCVGGSFAPPTALLSSGGRSQAAAAEQSIRGFTQRQSQILDCLRRGMANKLIAYELSMCESTVKVHVRNIMKKLSATNRTQVAYMTRGLFEGICQYQRA